ncbi:ATP-dependent Clp protease ATP-binding subunit [Streptomyces tanashiensis]
MLSGLGLDKATAEREIAETVASIAVQTPES